MTATAEREYAFMEQISNLKADLCSKIEEANIVEEKRARIEERLKRTMEQDQLHAITNTELDSMINIVKAENDKLQKTIEIL